MFERKQMAASTLNIERRRLHGYDFTAAEQCEKDLALAQMRVLNPEVPAIMREWVYDYITRELGDEEMSRRIASGHFESPSSRVVPINTAEPAVCE